MAWLKIYQSIREHRKILDAADDLEIEPPHMIGLLTSFWLWALDNAPDGNVSNISARNIARASQWKGDADKLLRNRAKHDPDPRLGGIRRGLNSGAGKRKRTLSSSAPRC